MPKQWPIQGMVLLYLFTRIWSYYFQISMLKTIFNSAVGKKGVKYRKYIGFCERLYGIYVLKITSYRKLLARYLVVNNVIAACITGVLLILIAIKLVLGVKTDEIVQYIILASVFVLHIPPIVLSFCVTTYSDGHPRYYFDLSRDFLTDRDKRQKSILLKEKKACILISPEEYGQRKRRYNRKAMP